MPTALLRPKHAAIRPTAAALDAFSPLTVLAVSMDLPSAAQAAPVRAHSPHREGIACGACRLSRQRSVAGRFGNPPRAALSRCLTRRPAGYGEAGPVSSGLLPVVRYGRFNSQSAQGDDVGVRLQHRRHATYAYDGSPPSQPPATPAPAGHLGSSEALSRESQVLYLGPGLEKSSSGDVGTGNTGRN
jgi:hypothetical protein